MHLPVPSAALIFDDGIFSVLLFFSSRTSKFRYSLTKKLQLLGTKAPILGPGALLLGPTGDFRPVPRPHRPPFADSKYVTAYSYLSWIRAHYQYHATNGHVPYRLVSYSAANGRPFTLMLSSSHSLGAATETALLSVDRGRSNVERFQLEQNELSPIGNDPHTDYNRIQN